MFSLSEYFKICIISLTGNIIAANCGLHIGYGEGFKNFEGLMDEVRIYNDGKGLI